MKRAGKKRVLLVEDHLGERIKVMKTLQDFDVEVETAVTFSRARELISKREYDFIFAELLLSHCPEMQGDGIQFSKHLQNQHPHTPVFLVAEEMILKTTEILMDGEAHAPIFSRQTFCTAIKDELSKTVKKSVA
ncbi:MAG: response regulator [Bdellovibrionales bacterium]|nr:response regulator [Bdellovibrionales bacterium]